MFASLYIIDNRRIFKTMQLFKLNTLTLLLIISKRYERYIIIEDFEDRNFIIRKL